MSASDRNPQYYCPLRDEFVNVGEADLLVVSKKAKTDLPKPGEPVAQANITVRRAYDEEREDILEICRYFWDETEFYCFDQTIDISQCINLLAVIEGEVAGLLSYRKKDDILVIVVLNVYPEFQGQGIARILLNEVMDQGRKQDCKKIIISTTNDDLPALYLYQKMGFQFSEILPGVIAEHHGEEIGGFAGLPVRDEIRMEQAL